MKSDNIYNQQLVAKIVLTAFFGAQVKEIENDEGHLEKCVCIPIDRNDLRIGRTGKVSAYAFVSRCSNANVMGWTHYMQMKSQNSFVRKMKDLGFKMPYLGNLKPWYMRYDNKKYEESFVKVNKDE